MLLSVKAEKPVGRAETEADDRKSTGEKSTDTDSG